MVKIRFPEDQESFVALPLASTEPNAIVLRVLVQRWLQPISPRTQKKIFQSKVSSIWTVANNNP